MMKTESDLMKGIDDKFQKLLSQFEMNMNIFEMKSKRQKLLVEQSKEDLSIKSDFTDNKFPETPKLIRNNIEQSKTTASHTEPVKGIANEVSPRGKIVTRVERNEFVPVKESSANNIERQDNAQFKKIIIDSAQDDNKTLSSDSMGTVLKYISDCGQVQKNKNKKRKKTISFIPQNEDQILHFTESDDNKSALNITQNKTKIKKKKNPIITSNDNLSKSSSKPKGNRSNEVLRKCSKTITNISKKGKKRNAKNNNVNGKDWISFNRCNAGKIQRSSKSKTQLINRAELKNANAMRLNKPKNLVKKEVEKQQRPVTNEKIEPYDTIENKLMNDFILKDKNDFSIMKKINLFNDSMKKPQEKLLKRKENERISFRDNTSPVKNIFSVDNKLQLSDTNKNKDTAKKITVTPPKKYFTPENNLRNEIKKEFGYKDKIAPRRNLSNSEEIQKNDMKISKSMDMTRKSALSNSESGKQSRDKFKTERDSKSDLAITRAKSEIKVRPSTSNTLGKDDICPDLEEMKVELDEYFSAIPFVVGRSISRTFNLGLSFQHAMSMLKRIHSSKEVKEVLNIARPDSGRTESLHCLSGNVNCEAMFSSDWTKEDEDAWEDNPWDPELNRRRPKCTCLPNSCTTLKNVLKQLTIKNPGFSVKPPLQPYLSSISNKMESDVDILKRPDLKRAKSHTRTELLRNIRSIQFHLTPSTEII